MTMLLAIETATAACSVALWCDGTETHAFEVVGRGHAERLLPMLAATTAEANVDLAEVAAIGVGIGPGAFTSLRIGIAAARGLALALDRPCFGVTSLEALAAAACPLAARQQLSCVLAALDSKRRDLFVQPFAAEGAPLAAPSIIADDGAAALLEAVGVRREETIGIAGDGASMVAASLSAAGYAHRIIDECRHPTALSVVRLTALRWLAGERPQMPPRPLYLRPADTGPPLAAEASAGPPAGMMV